jgi:hypothetical protein
MQHQQQVSIASYAQGENEPVLTLMSLTPTFAASGKKTYICRRQAGGKRPSGFPGRKRLCNNPWTQILAKQLLPSGVTPQTFYRKCHPY